MDLIILCAASISPFRSKISFGASLRESMKSINDFVLLYAKEATAIVLAIMDNVTGSGMGELAIQSLGNKSAL